MDFIDDIFEDFSRALRGELSDSSPISAPEHLDASRLDYSVDSLHVVDAYLDKLHELRGQGMLTQDAENSILYGGAYVGEVIRWNSDEDWHWADYDDYVTVDPKLREMLGPRSLATCAALIAPDENLVFCVQKPLRFIEEGREHSTHYFAQALGRLR